MRWELSPGNRDRGGNKNQRSETTGPQSRVLSLSLATSSHDCFKISHKLAISPNDQAGGRISNISSPAWLKVTDRTQVFVFRLGSVRACQIETEQKSEVRRMSLNSEL